MSLLDEIGDVVERERASKVTNVRLRVGRLSGVSPAALTFAWDLARAGTVAAEADLHIDEVPVAVYCPRCEHQGEPREGGGLMCAGCAEAAPLLLRGRELELIAVEIL
ncbi:MAG: hydrogenase maturation nickel metallochaperone HypA [Candidatus Eremiobacteraeota bacterium]|nr:hydrogenase maturation nickel metallochaperone HypA [Candidatus Eremiobacteraeota bacterium]